MQVVANHPYHHLPGVEAHTHAQFRAAAAMHLLGIGLHGYLHSQGGIAGAQGMVRVGNRSAKQGHNAVAYSSYTVSASTSAARNPTLSISCMRYRSRCPVR